MYLGAMIKVKIEYRKRHNRRSRSQIEFSFKSLVHIYLAGKYVPNSKNIKKSHRDLKKYGTLDKL